MPERPELERLREVTTPLEEHETPNHEHGLEEEDEDEDEDESFQLSKTPLGSDSMEEFLKANNIVTASSSAAALENTCRR